MTYTDYNVALEHLYGAARDASWYDNWDNRKLNEFFTAWNAAKNAPPEVSRIHALAEIIESPTVTKL